MSASDKRAKQWSEEEKQKLVEELDQGLSLAKVAGLHKRSEWAITIQMRKFLFKKQQGGESIARYYERWPVTEDEMAAFVASGGKCSTYNEHVLEERIVALEKKVAALEARFDEKSED